MYYNKVEDFDYVGGHVKKNRLAKNESGAAKNKIEKLSSMKWMGVLGFFSRMIGSCINLFIMFWEHLKKVSK